MPNKLMAKTGDHVEISVPARSLLKISMLVYLVPIIALMVGAYAGGAWAPLFNMGSNPGSLLGAAFGMGLSFYLLKRVNRSIGSKDKYAIRMTRILFNADTFHDQDEQTCDNR